jgi:hypothetical protein
MAFEKKVALMGAGLVILIITVFAAIQILNNKKAIIADGLPYENRGLGFSLVLPKSFEYFQTQRIDSKNSKELEIFIPTSDKGYPQEVPGYAKPLVIMVMEDKNWVESGGNNKNDEKFTEIGRKNNTVFSIRFWNKPPKEWESRWNDGLKNEILKNINLF